MLYLSRSVFQIAGVFAVAAIAGCAGSMAVDSAPEPAGAHASAVALGEIAPGVHNLFIVGRGVYSGSTPEGPEAFDALAAMGVTTLVSVDGARPQIELARERGMRYVHIPVGYDGVSAGDQLALAAALQESDGPVYVHCHHGKHRGPAAAALAMIATGEITAGDAESFMAAAGTSERYPGLWACVREAQPIADIESIASGVTLVEHRRTSGLVEGMAAIARTWERIGLVRDAGWASPASHPDIAPAAEAGILADHFRVLLEDPDVTESGEEFVAMMRASLQAASRLEEALVTRRSEDAIAATYASVGWRCMQCHEAYRD